MIVFRIEGVCLRVRTKRIALQSPLGNGRLVNVCPTCEIVLSCVLQLHGVLYGVYK